MLRLTGINQLLSLIVAPAISESDPFQKVIPSKRVQESSGKKPMEGIAYVRANSISKTDFRL